jgi:diaminopimelate epimerase
MLKERSMLRFTKMNGAGNDFVLLDNRDGNMRLDRATLAHLCDRHRGVGADGVLVVESPQDGADYRMRYYNSDGGEAEMCGNGARCFARFAAGLRGDCAAVSFETMAGVIRGRFVGNDVCIQMSEPHSLRLQTTLQFAGEKHAVHSINTGVPHAVVFVADLEGVDVRKLGAALRHHENFAPTGANANFCQQLDGQTLAIRTYERGVENETLACGSGVVACALIFNELTDAGSPVHIKGRGGDLLAVGFDRDRGRFHNITLTGPADFVFDGEIAL